MQKISDKSKRLKKKMGKLELQRKVLGQKLSVPKNMLEGSLVKRWTRCGNAGCECRKDNKARHGPYWYLTYQRGGQYSSKYIGSDSDQLRKVRLYSKHQANLAAFRQVNKEIDALLMELRNLYLERPDKS